MVSGAENVRIGGSIRDPLVFGEEILGFLGLRNSGMVFELLALTLVQK